MPAHPCSRCGAPATLFLGSLAGAEILSLALCPPCPTEPAMNAPLPAAAAGLNPAIPLPAGRARCPDCGFRWSDFERHQRLGCPSCYGAHAGPAAALVGRSQPGLVHQGRRPGSPVAPLQREMEGLRAEAPAEPPPRAELEAALAAAVRKENFEEAARLRDLLAGRGPAP